jgi:hypothetical protein
VPNFAKTQKFVLEMVRRIPQNIVLAIFTKLIFEKFKAVPGLGKAGNTEFIAKYKTLGKIDKNKILKAFRDFFTQFATIGRGAYGGRYGYQSAYRRSFYV